MHYYSRDTHRDLRINLTDTDTQYSYELQMYLENHKQILQNHAGRKLLSSKRFMWSIESGDDTDLLWWNDINN